MKRSGSDQPSGSDYSFGKKSKREEGGQTSKQRRHYFIGLAIGFIPVAIFLTIIVGGLKGGLAEELGLIFGVIFFPLYFALLGASIICLCIKRVRFVGYGLLTMIIIPLVVECIMFIVFRFVLVSH